jgi:hypothetical protein
MTFLANPAGLTPKEFEAYVAGLHWRAWKPKFITLHNTAEPSLKQWAHGSGQIYEHQRIVNLNHYYKTLGWHSGPHLFISPALIWVACDLTADGVSVSCWNRVTLGVEMVGDYSVEDFTSGDGAHVRDNTVAALAILHKALGLKPSPYKTGVEGLHPHRDCVKDHHDCPGKHVDIADLRARIAKAMG